MRLGSFKFHFGFKASTSTHWSVAALSVLAICKYIDSKDHDLPVNFDALFNHARILPRIRAILLLFDSIDHLQKSMEPFVQVLDTAAETIDLILVYKGEEERRGFGVDLGTLQPNGASSVMTLLSLSGS